MSDSPFLPGTNIQYAWDSTSLGYLKTCPRLYYYTMIEGWTSHEESVHLRFGIEYHSAMQDYDTSRAAGIKHEDAIFDVVNALMARTQGWDSDHEKKNRESLVRAVIWYLDKFGDNAEETYILKSGKPAVELSFKFDLDFGPTAYIDTDDSIGPGKIFYSDGTKGPNGHHYMLCGHLDKVVSVAGDLYPKDYKSVFSFWGQRWEPDNQMTLYTLAAKVVLQSPIRGVIVDMVTFKTSGGYIIPEFQRMVTQRTPDQLDEWLKDLRSWLASAERYAIENDWPMNDTSCGKYGGCRFRDICSKSPSVRQRFLESNFKQLPQEERWNPLRSR